MFPMKGVLTMELYDGAGNVARFGEVISAGGEGEVRASACWDDVVVKLYRDPSPERRAKVESLAVLGSMINTFGHGPLQHVCWPLCPVYADAHQEEFLGFCMKRAPEGSIPLSELYRYPHVDHGVSHAERVDVLLRLVDILDALHGSSFGGHPLVVGDLSGDNVLVSPCGDVCLIDADTFSFANDGALYPCMACAPGVAPPELLRAARGRSYQQMAEAGEQTFTVESDRFALASLIFRTLCIPLRGAQSPTRTVTIRCRPMSISRSARVRRRLSEPHRGSPWRPGRSRLSTFRRFLPVPTGARSSAGRGMSHALRRSNGAASSRTIVTM